MATLYFYRMPPERHYEQKGKILKCNKMPLHHTFYSMQLTNQRTSVFPDATALRVDAILARRGRVIFPPFRRYLTAMHFPSENTHPRLRRLSPSPALVQAVAKSIGFESFSSILPAAATHSQVLECIQYYNKDPRCHSRSPKIKLFYSCQIVPVLNIVAQHE